MSTRLTDMQRRAGAIRHELCRMSRNGWRDAKPSDYQPLESELDKLERLIRDRLHPKKPRRAS